jgi:hypothetical protein
MVEQDANRNLGELTPLVVIRQASAPPEEMLYISEADPLMSRQHPPLPPPVPVPAAVIAQPFPFPIVCYDYQRDCVYVQSSLHNPEPRLLATSSSLRLGEDRDDPEKTRMAAAGVAGAVVGSLLLGPFLGVIAGFGSAYATQKPGAAGDIARALGEVALVTRDKAREIDQQHHLVSKSKRAIADVWERTKELDRQHRILDRIKDFLFFSCREIVDFTLRNRLLEKGVEATGRGFEVVFKKVCGGDKPRVDSTTLASTTSVWPY